MYEIIYHILGLAILEIIFYFEYVGPMETTVFNNSINDAIKSEEKNINNDDKTLISSILQNDDLFNLITGNRNKTEFILHIEHQHNDAIKNKNDYNNSMYQNCINIWLICLGIVLFLTLLIKLIIYFWKKNKSKNYNQNGEIEMNNINRNTLNIIGLNPTESNYSNETEILRHRNLSEENIEMEIHSSVEPQTQTTETPSFFQSKKYKFIKYFFYYIFSFGGIILFEYVFFNNVILKYKITTNEEIKYLLFKFIEPYLQNG